jgi:phenylacetate-CoA ligase
VSAFSLSTPGRKRIASHQLARLNAPDSGLALLRDKNTFYRERLRSAVLPLRSLEELESIAFTRKPELVRDQKEHPPYGTNLTFEATEYTRIHSTSGTSGRRLSILDTPEGWDWFTGCWQEIYRVFGVGPGDRVFVAFGFGPFVGFWAGFEAAHRVGALAIPGGGQSSLQRLTAILEHEATVVVATPTYALRLAEVAVESGMDLPASSVRALVHAGEPGASIPSTRGRIEAAWGARCWDHAGLTEVGAWGFECPAGEGLHVLESEFIAEVRAVDSDLSAREGETGELVLTNLGRWATPAVRYRTGDLVRWSPSPTPCACGSAFVAFRGGVLGRSDDMIQVRGVNVYPGAIETIIREEAAVVEFQVEVYEQRQMWEMRATIEIVSGARPETVSARLASTLRSRLGLRTEVEVVPTGTLPRFELKANRFRKRNPGALPDTTK